MPKTFRLSQASQCRRRAGVEACPWVCRDFSSKELRTIQAEGTLSVNGYFGGLEIELSYTAPERRSVVRDRARTIRARLPNVRESDGHCGESPWNDRRGPKEFRA